MAISTISEAIEDIRNGKMIILVDDEDRENEGDLCLAAQFTTPEAINFMARNGRGLIGITVDAEIFHGISQDVPDAGRLHFEGFQAVFDSD